MIAVVRAVAATALPRQNQTAPTRMTPAIVKAARVANPVSYHGCPAAVRIPWAAADPATGKATARIVTNPQCNPKATRPHDQRPRSRRAALAQPPRRQHGLRAGRWQQVAVGLVLEETHQQQGRDEQAEGERQLLARSGGRRVGRFPPARQDEDDLHAPDRAKRSHGRKTITIRSR